TRCNTNATARGSLDTRSGHPNPENFVWEEYLQETGSTAAPISAFTLVRIEERAPHGFQVNHKLEAVDRRNPMLIRVATVTDTEDYRFDVWCDSDLCDLHPVGWCQRTGHPLEPPPGQTYRSERDRLVRQTGQTVLQFRRKVIAGQIHSLLSCV
uniref:L3MBTL histone methyl-lysine binding protein 4 n=1 Tax=Haplochromis burtoni TaxID=8153 RepID=A0A3Q2V6X3_HAPBU